MRRKQLVCVDRESEFRVDELFFSTTDSRGVIKYCNDVFVRVSGYEQDDLIGQPHSKIRHPDMPASVFRVFWDMVQAGDTIAAYVKNRSKNGEYYWVMAVAAPIKGGYLSVRMKPTSELLSVVADVYARVLADEETASSEGLSKDAIVEVGLASLMKEINALGFSDYVGFMHHAMVQESMRREEDMIRMPRPEPLSPAQRVSASQQEIVLADLAVDNAACDSLLSGMLEGLSALGRANETFLEACESTQQQSEMIGVVGMNAKVSASTAVLEAISGELTLAEAENRSTITDLKESVRRLSLSLTQLEFNMSVANIQCEIASHFIRQVRESDHGSAESLLQMLLEQSDIKMRELFEQVANAEAWFREIETLTAQLQRNAKTLRFIRMAGVTESTRLDPSHAFVGLFETVKVNVLATFNLCTQLRMQIKSCSDTIAELANKRNRLSIHLDAILDASNTLVGCQFARSKAS